MKYRKKPVVIEAFRFQVDNEMPDWFHVKVITKEIITHEDGTCDIYTLEGVMRADKGDYIILGVKGEVYPCKPDIFRETYEFDLASFAGESTVSIKPEGVTLKVTKTESER